MKRGLLKIFGRLVYVGALIALVIVVASLRTSAEGITFATNGLDLKIDSSAWYNNVAVPSATWSLKNLVPGSDHFFNFNDIKPGDSGRNLMSMHVKKSSAWMCLDFYNLTNTDNGVNEPESSEDPNGSLGGELANNLQFFSWIDNGNGIFQVGEKPLFGTSTKAASVVLNGTSYAIADTQHGPACADNSIKYVGIVWCAGTLNVNLSTAAISCDGSMLGNAIQTDSMSVDVAIRALPSGQHSKFNCGTTTPRGGNHDDNGDDDDDDNGGNHGTTTPPKPKPPKPPKNNPWPTMPPFPSFPQFPAFPTFPSMSGHIKNFTNSTNLPR